MAYSAAQINTIFQAVLQRPADTYAIQTFANSSQSDASVRTQIETSYEASVNVNPVIRLYQGAFGRVPDTGGLQANYNTYINGYNIVQLAQNFLSSTEGQNKFGASASVTAGFVSTLYTQALGRTAGSSEISYWQGTGKSAAQVLAEISNSTEAVNKEAAPIVTWLDSAAVAGLNGGQPNSGSLYSQTSSTGGNTGGSTGNPGSNIAFTSLVGDNLQGTSGNDTFSGVNATTIQTGDVVTGNGGVDTVTYTGTATAAGGTTTALQIPTLNGISVVNISGRAPAAATDGGITANFANTSVSLVTLQNQTVLGDAITLKSGQVAGLDNVKVGATATTSTQAIATAAATEVFNFGTGTTASLALANGTNITGSNTNVVGGATTVTANTVDLQGANLTTINVLSAGTTANTVSTLIDSTLGGSTALKTLNISGTAGLTLGTTIATLTAIDATANSAGVKFSGTEANLTSAKFGSGNDSFLTGDTFGATAGTLTAAQTATIDGGAGLNYLGANFADLTNLLNSTTANKITNFQVLEVQTAANTGAAVAASTYDLSKLAGASSIQFDAAVTAGAGVASQTYTNLQAGGSIAFNAGVTTTSNTDLTFSLASGQTNATETVFLQANTGAVLGAGAAGAANGVNVFQLQNVSTLNLNVRDIAGTGTAGITTFAGVNDSALTTLNLQSTATDSTGAATKAAALVLGTNSLTTGFSTTALATVDATGYSGNVDASGLSVNLSTAGATIKGGAGELYAVGGTGNDTITSGSGGGIFNGGTGTDTITVSSASSANVVLTQTGVTTGTKVLDVIQNTTGQNATSGTADSVVGFHLGGTAATSDVLAFNGAATGANAAATFAAATAGGANVTVVAGAVNGSAAGQNGTTVTISASGIATVSGATGTAAVDALQKYMNTAGVAANSVAAIIVNSDTYVVHNGASNTVATDDAIVKLVGISSETAISTTAFSSSTIHIA